LETSKQLIKHEIKGAGKEKAQKTTIILLGLLLLFTCALGGSLIIANQLKPVSASSALVQVEIPKGASSKKIGAILADHKLIRSQNLFYYFTRFKGLDQDLKAGIFNLDASWSLEKIALSLTKSTQGPSISFTIPEGFNLKQIAARLEDKGLVSSKDFFKTVNSSRFAYGFLEDLPQGEQWLEGFLFPDTYQVKENAPPEEIINTMLRRFGEIYDAEMQARTRELGLSVLELVTMASIIEKEGKLDEERSIIAGVFYNRLKAKWLLESCATVQYLLDEPKEILLYSDLEIESPYNTYKYGGLPPGPIASPGKSSLKAALYPAEVDYMFFVAEKDGSHYFSKTLAEHESAAKRIANEK